MHEKEYIKELDKQAEVKFFLRTRRNRITPEDAGIISTGRRRVAGLRREEVAFLAGISAEYYAQIERGNVHSVSPKILQSIADVLQLNPAETSYFLELTRPDITVESYLRASIQPDFKDMQELADSVTPPAWISSHRLDFVTANAAGKQLLSPFITDKSAGGNLARYIFLSPGSRSFFPEWNKNADSVISVLRQHLAQFSKDQELIDLIEQLQRESEEFKKKWETYNLHYHNLSYKQINHPELGVANYHHQCLTYANNPEFALIVFLPVHEN